MFASRSCPDGRLLARAGVSSLPGAMCLTCVRFWGHLPTWTQQTGQLRPRTPEMELLLGVPKRMTLAKAFLLSLSNCWNIPLMRLHRLQVWVSSLGQCWQHSGTRHPYQSAPQKTAVPRRGCPYWHTCASTHPTQRWAGEQRCPWPSAGQPVPLTVVHLLLGRGGKWLFLLFPLGLGFLLLLRACLLPWGVLFRLAPCKPFSSKLGPGHLLTGFHLPQDCRDWGWLMQARNQRLVRGEAWPKQGQGAGRVQAAVRSASITHSPTRKGLVFRWAPSSPQIHLPSPLHSLWPACCGAWGPTWKTPRYWLGALSRYRQNSPTVPPGLLPLEYFPKPRKAHMVGNGIALDHAESRVTFWSYNFAIRKRTEKSRFGLAEVEMGWCRERADLSSLYWATMSALKTLQFSGICTGSLSPWWCHTERGWGSQCCPGGIFLKYYT